MQVQITINTDGAAFCDDDGEPDEFNRSAEVGRILREVTELVQDGHRGRPLFDFLGNMVGGFAVFDGEG